MLERSRSLTGVSHDHRTAFMCKTKVLIRKSHPTVNAEKGTHSNKFDTTTPERLKFNVH
jgi:hypothetical protein